MKNENLIESAGGIVVRKTKRGFFVVLLYKNNYWVLPKGRIEQKESKEKAALREIHEETGIPLDKMRIIIKLGEVNYIARQPVDNFLPRPKTVTYFLVETSYRKIKPLKTDEFSKASWVSLNHAFKKVAFSNNKIIILRAIKHLNNEYLNKIDTVIIAVGGRGERMVSSEAKKVELKLLLLIEGQPFLKYLLDIVLKLKFRRIYLLTSYYHKEIRHFVRSFYPNNKKIKIIYAGKVGQKGGVTMALYKTKDFIRNPFVYIDGNVIFQPYLLKRLSSEYSLAKSIIKSAVSPNDLAPTHLKVLIKNHKIKETSPRLTSYPKPKTSKDYFCSIGIMAIDHKIFDLLPDFNKFYDLDLVIDFLFKKRLNTNINLIDFLKYDSEWYCIHTQKDIKTIKQKGRKFFCSLKT